MRTRRLLCALGAAVAVLACALGASGSVRGTAPAGGLSPSAAAGILLSSPPIPKLDSRLAELADVARTRNAGTALATADSVGVDVAGSRVRVIVESGDPDAANAAVAAADGTVEAAAGDFTRAVVAPGDLVALTKQPGVDFVRPPYDPVPETVPTDEGVASTNANVWQARGLTGTGQKVAIVDVGFNGYAAAGLGSVTTQDCTGTACSSTLSSTFNSTSHGTAVAAVAHAMAPGAKLYLVAVKDEVGLAAAEKYAKTQGVKVINESLGWFNTDRGDGTGGKSGNPASTVAKAKADGILWVNAAGDQAQEHWSGTWADANTNTLNDFAAGDEGDTFHLDHGGSMCAYLKWDAWPKPSTEKLDFDLFLTESAPGPAFPPFLGTPGVNTQVGQTPPVEQVCYTNTGESRDLDLRIEYNDTTGTTTAPTRSPRFDLFLTGDAGPLQYSTPAGSIVEPASSPNALAVGAYCNGVETYSSRGPTIAPVAGVAVTKPDLVAPDSSCGGGVAGTSASAPHVAGAAALVLQQTPMPTIDQVKALLLTSARDVGDPGPDADSGAGRLRLPVSPAITSFTPPSGPVGTVVTLTGTDLAGTTSVDFHGTATPVTPVSNTSVKATVPDGATTGLLSALGGDAPAPSATEFKVTPRVDGFTPSSGPVGTEVTITGHNFDGVTAVKFGTLAATVVTPVDGQTVTATVPPGATTGKVTVTVGTDSAASAASFTVILGPTITTVSPVKAPVGGLVTVAGTNLDSISAVTISGVPVDALTKVSATKLTFKVPADAVDGDLKVTNPAASFAKPFVVTPSITQITDHAAAGAPVEIDGYNLGPAPTVKLNGVTASVDTDNSNLKKVIASFPATAKSGKITVATSDGIATSAATFNVVLAPTVSSFSPAFGAVGSTVTVTGTNLTYVGTVALNGHAVDDVAHSGATKLTFKVPGGAGSGSIHVENAAGFAEKGPFKIVPRVDGFDPDHGTVDQEITITGLDFGDATKVTFNGKLDPTAVVNGDGTITAHVPTGATSGKIGVANATGGTTSAGTFIVVGPPTIASFAPAAAPVGATITITGTNLQYATKVTFPNGLDATIAGHVGQTQATMLVPEGDWAAASGKLTVTNASTTSAASTGVFKLLPGIAGVDETQGVHGDVVHFHGTHVQAPLPITNVTFNGVAATPTNLSATGFDATIPPTATTGKIAVTTANGTVTLPDTFKVVVSPAISSFTPAAAPVGGVVTVTGAGVGDATSATIDGVTAAIQSAPSATQLKLVVPGDATPTGTITVTNIAATSGPSKTFKVTPTISGTTVADIAADGDTFTINGAGFGGPGSPPPTVTLNGKPVASDAAFTPTAIAAAVPAGATSGPLVVTTAGGTATRAFKVTPAVTDVTPGDAAAGGTSITVTGTTFGGATAVKIGLVPVPFKLVNATTITITSIPAAAVTGKVFVTTASGTAPSPADFVVDPTVTKLTPVSGATGSTVTVTGTGFAGAPQVLFGAGRLASPSVTSVTATSLKAVVPDGADNASVVRVENADGGADGPSFAVNFGISDFSPASAPIGTNVAINGVGFTGMTGVHFGSVAATDWTKVSDTQATALVPLNAVDGKITVDKGADHVTSARQFAVGALPDPTVASERIVFARRFCDPVSACGIWIMNGDGSGKTQLTQDTATTEDSWPSLSADGKKVAFMREVGSSDTIETMSSAGTGLTPLGAGTHPTWSPDGSKLAFVDADADDDNALWTIAANGTGRTQITTPDGQDGSPKWLGSTLAFVRDPGDASSILETLSPVAAGGTLTPVITKAATNVSTVEWSPDGTKLLYSQFSSPLRVVNLNGGNDHALPSSAQNPSWTHCSRIVVDGIAVMFADGTSSTPLTFNSNDSQPSCWEPAELHR